MTQYMIDLLGHKLLITADKNKLINWRWLPADTTETPKPSDGKCTLREMELIDNTVREITEFIEGKRHTFKLVDPEPEGTAFQRMVWDEIRTIPYGKTRTYAWIAERIGRPNSFRAVANACGKNPFPIVIPCHRVVGSNGRPGGYTGGLDIKQALQDIEQQFCTAAKEA